MDGGAHLYSLLGSETRSVEQSRDAIGGINNRLHPTYNLFSTTKEPRMGLWASDNKRLTGSPKVLPQAYWK